MKARFSVTIIAALAMFTLGVTGAAAAELSPKAINAALDAAYEKYRGLQEGKNADYIPALAKVDPDLYGIALVTTDGKVFTEGDVGSEVSIQSISKVFTMAKVIEERGPDAIAGNMGVDATGQVFNSIVAIEQYRGAEMNAMVNPGAITATSMVAGGSREEIWNKILGYYSDFAGRTARGQPGSLRIRGGDQPAQPGHRPPDVRLRPHQGQPRPGHRHLHRAVLGQRQCEGSRHDGGDPGQRRRAIRSPGSRCMQRQRAEGARRDGDGRTLRRFRQVALRRPACPPRAASAAASSPYRRVASASP